MESKSTNPWKGLKFYEEGEVLYGRNSEIETLLSRIVNNVQTVIYGRSGIGKTSIMNAGIFPRARILGYTPVAIRLEHNGNKSYLEQIVSAIGNAGIIAHEQVAPASDDRDSLWEFMHRNTFTDSNGYKTVPMIVFDQFEEIFTLQKDELIRLDFFCQLADLLNNVAPDYIVGTTSSTEKTGNSENHAGPDKSAPQSRDLDDPLFDDDDDDSSDYVLEKYITSPDYRIVFILRDDFLSYLERYTVYIPMMKQNRFPLLPLNEEQAAEIIMRPRSGLVSTTVAHLIIEKVTGQHRFTFDGIPEIEVDAAVLSLYLSRLYDMRKDDTPITQDLVLKFGDNIIKDFYNESIQGISNQTVNYLEDVLLTSSGRRNNVSLSDLLSNNVSQADIDTLADGRGGRRLLHLFQYGNDTRVEYIHDVLCPVVTERKEHRKADEEIRRLEHHKQILEQEREKDRKERNREYNRKEREKRSNVLTQHGRELINNSLDIGDMPSLRLPYRNYGGDDTFFIFQIIRHETVYILFGDDNLQESRIAIADPQLSGATYRVEFSKDGKPASTVDGIYAVRLKYKDERISDVMFYGKGVRNGVVNYNTPVYVFGGFCGMHIDYTHCSDEERARGMSDSIVRTYLDENGQPTECLYGYSAVEVILDGNGCPVETKYYCYKDGKRTPCPHIEGNYGFRSTFDDCGNEIQRVFTGADGKPVRVYSGVYGKRMTYDPKTFKLMEIMNTDKQGNAMPDICGCAIERYEYDSVSGRKMRETYYDEKGEIFELIDGRTGKGSFCSSSYTYDLNKLSVVQMNYNKDGNPTSSTGSSFGSRLIYNEKRQLTEIVLLDANGKPDENQMKVRFSYDDANQIKKILFFDRNDVGIDGLSYDFDHKGMHVLRRWVIDINGENILDPNYGDENTPVFGLEYVRGMAPDAPQQNYFISKNGQRIACCDGYYLLGVWQNRDGDDIKERYYDMEGNPMPDKRGIYGIRTEYSGDTTRYTYLDRNDMPMAREDGLSAFEEEKRHNFRSLRFYDINGKLWMANNYCEIRTVTEQSGENSIKTEKLYDDKGNMVSSRYHVEIYDSKGRIIEEKEIDRNGNIVDDDNGNTVIRTEYHDDKHFNVVTTHYDAHGNRRECVEGWCQRRQRVDRYGREVDVVYYDNIATATTTAICKGTYGKTTVYGDHKRTITYTDAAGTCMDNDEGYAVQELTFDDKGRMLSDLRRDERGRIVGKCDAREYVDEAGKMNCYYQYSLGEDGKVTPDENGIFYFYQEDDERGRLVKSMFLDKDRAPHPDSVGNYGYTNEYASDGHGQQIVTTTYLDENGKPHNCSKGYGILKQWKDRQGLVTRQIVYTCDGKPYQLDDGSYGYSFTYLPNGSKITGYLDADRNIMKCNFGYAYKETWSKGNNSYECFFDAKGYITIDLGYDSGDYGRHIIENGNITALYGMGADGLPHTDKNGAWVKIRETEEDGKIREHYEDSKGNKIKDWKGDYGEVIETTCDGLLRKTTSYGRNGGVHNNHYGYCYLCQTTDVLGNEVRVYYDKDGKQVLPKRSLKATLHHKLDSIRARFRNIGARTVLYPYQMGAQGLAMIVECSQAGARRWNIPAGCYLALKAEEWKPGEIVIADVKNGRLGKDTMDMVLIPFTNDGDKVIIDGYTRKATWPVMKYNKYKGMTITYWYINMETIKLLNKIAHEDNGKAHFTVEFNRYTGTDVNMKMSKDFK